jgi:hypothetical protein
MTKISNQYSLTNVLTADVVNGRVGINNGSPTVALDVTGAARVSGISTFTTTSASTSVFNSTEANGGYITFQRSGTSYGFIGSAYHLLTPVGANTDLAVSTTGAFIVGTGASLIPRMTITAAGNVGIGTSSPNISGGASGSTALTISASESGRNGILELKGTRTASGQISSYIRSFSNSATSPGVDLVFYRGAADTDGELAIATSGTERMRITSGGSVAIGTTTTGYKLHVEATSANYAMLIKQAGGDASFRPLTVWHAAESGNRSFINFEINAAGNSAGSINFNSSWVCLL